MNATITADDKFTCAEREVKMRKKVYPRWVADGRMSEGKAALEIQIMEAIANDYRAAAEKERLI